MITLLAGTLASAIASASPLPIETTTLPVPGQNGNIALHCVTTRGNEDKAVLFIHGSTFSTKLAAGFEFHPGDSWMHFMANQGYVACGLDFMGFGESSFSADMQDAQSAHSPVLRATEAADQIAVAMDHIHAVRGIKQVHVVAHSWGTIPAATYAARHPHDVTSLTLFGPVVPKSNTGLSGATDDAWFPLTAQQRLEQLRFKAALPPGKVLLEPRVESKWAAEFRSSTPVIGHDDVQQIRIPNGPNVDVGEAVSGKYPYSPETITAPIFVVYGNYEVVLDDAEASRFLSRFTASTLKWQLRISDGTHVMHLERQRWSLYESVAAFLTATSETAP